MFHRSSVRLRAAGGPAFGALIVAALALALAGCTADSEPSRSAPAVNGSEGAGHEAGGTGADAVQAVSVSANVAKAGVPVDKRLTLTAKAGTFKSVRVTGAGERLPGALSADRTTWTAEALLEPGTAYTIRSVALDAAGEASRSVKRFRTEPLSLDEQTYPSIAPLDGETVGVGMPVIVQFDVAVTDRASIERHLRVESEPQQVGAWHWLSDHEVHWRPKRYWKPGTDVTVHADINSIPAGNGIYGQLSRTSSFHVGDAVVMAVDVAAHRMTVSKNGKALRTIPVSAGKPGFTTRSGVKVIIEKFRTKRMDAATTGIRPGDPEYYNIANVEYAQRVTYSGEFLHAAPWSVGSQGSANVSHGCVGMSTGDAAWLYGLTKRGDIVDVRGSDRHMTLENGYGDWNLSFAEYRKGSALA